MTLLLVFLVAGLLGWAVGEFWLVALPAMLGVLYLLAAVVLRSLEHRDDPILFILLLAMLAMTVGVLARRRTMLS